ncbi:hypothetical protein QR680_009238 [Steinernema hermaphroditum]|uniref:HECT domain-containing protein n=1 Tax=Steinernema hermaphroditum TaxID=289476 RepID=A0AA39IKX3_9BILA|nr:hypothetical protein QR680_009238 [Steinernema hermaphroditum]
MGDSKASQCPPEFVCSAVQQQKQGHTLYGCAFNQLLPDDFPPVLATLTVYMFTDDDSKSFFPIIQYQDPCKEESLYAITWTYNAVTDRHACVIGGERGIIRVVDSSDGRVWKTLIGHGGAVNDLRTFSKDSSIVASASKDLTVRLWNVRFSECIAILGGTSGHRDQVLSIDFDERGEYLVSGSMDHSIMLWNVSGDTDVGRAIEQSLDPVKPRPQPVELHFPVAQSRDLHANYVDCVRFVGEFLISKSCERNIQLWKFGEVRDGAAGRGNSGVVETFSCHMVLMNMPDLDTWFARMDVDLHRKYLLCGTQSGSLRFWKLDEGLPTRTHNFEVRGYVKNSQSKFMVRQAVFSHRGDVVAACGANGLVARFDRMKKTLYGFGLGVDGQFGIRLSGVADSGCVVAPQQLFGVPLDEHGVSVSSVACGERHTVLLSADGKLWSVGANEYGQLGRSGADHGSFTIYPVDMNVGTRIIQIAAGQNHSAAVSDDGRLFVWGRNSEFQCARTSPATLSKPTRVVEITEAVQVACGANSCMALQQSGNVYVWGACLGETVAIPRLIHTFSKIPVVQISAGDDHFVALTSAGCVYAWGRNEYGQCGTGDTGDHKQPKIIKHLSSMKTVSVSCGGNHTVALTKDGRLFSFGYNVFGQLGTGRKEEVQADPQLVAELLGSHITKVACGRVHTVAVVNGRIFSFGLNANGQLGTGCLSNAVITPQVVRELQKVTTIFAGYDQTFAIEAPEVDLMSSPSGPLETPKFLSMSRLRQLFTEKSDNKLDIIAELESVFSSTACFNGSFAYTDDRRFNCCPTNIAMNLDDCMYTFNMIANHGDADGLGEIIVNCLKMGVFDNGNLFGRCLPSENPEVCKFLMAVPWFHEMVHPEKYYEDLFVPFVKLLTSFKRYAPELLRRWWSGLATRHFNKVVLVLMTGVEYQIDHNETVDQFDMIVALRLLKYLHKLNQDHSKIPADHFYLDSLMGKTDVRSDYFMWATDGSSEIDENELQKPFHFVDYPFLYNAEAKSTLLEAEAQFAMYQAAQRPSTAVIPYLGIAQFIRPTFNIEVRRSNIVEDTISILENVSPHDFAKPLRVQFVSEEAQDEGGVRKEFFLLLFQQLLQPHYGMFVEDPESHFVWFSGLDLADPVSFNFVGRLCALAVYNAILVDFPFPSALYKLLLDYKANDLMMLHPTEGRSLQSVSDYEGNNVEDVFGLTFQISIDMLGDAVDVELKPGGKDIPVTNENRAEFIRLYIQRRLELGVGDIISQQLTAFRNGFRNVMRSKILDFFQPHELMELMVGNENYDWDVFKKNTDYKGEYHAGHNAIKAFWDAFFELDLEQRKKFLLFLMGSARIPVAGMKQLKMVIQPIPSKLYPVAHTCFNLLDLPNISDKAEMKRRLLMCIEHTQGFTLVLQSPLTRYRSPEPSVPNFQLFQIPVAGRSRIMAASRTFGLIKPDAVSNPFVLRRIVNSLSASKEIEIVAAKRLRITRDQAVRLYEAHKGKFFFDRLVRHVTSGPSIALLMESRCADIDAVAAWRAMLGSSKLFRNAFCERTLRTQFALSETRNVGHGSDGLKDTLRELAIFEPLCPFVAGDLFEDEQL